MSNKQHISFFVCLITALLLTFQTASGNSEYVSCPLKHIVPERLPDMNVARSGHNIFFAHPTNGRLPLGDDRKRPPEQEDKNVELTVTGGHTNGFVPTQTAEYFINGKWHTMAMTYTHDNGFAVTLRSGETIIGGGHEKPLGIGQSFLMECYNPATHTFEGFGCLDCPRVLANATQLADGRVVISGNHYAPDAIACYDGRLQVEHLKSLRQERSNPYILPIADDDALIVSGSDLYMNHHDTIWVDRLKGEAFRVPLLDRWRPVFTDQPFCSEACAVGEDSYLLTVRDQIGQLAIVVVRDTTFTLLPTTSPIPMRSPFGSVVYKGPVVVDRNHQRGYVVGVDSLCRRQYILAIDYARQPAPVTLYYTDSLEHSAVAIPILTPEGDLILAGGNPEDNYKPLATVWLYRFATQHQVANTSIPLWLWVVLSIAVLGVIAYMTIIYMCGSKSCTTTNIPTTSDQELMQHICQAIEFDQRYLAPRLRPSNIADELGVSVTTLTNCIDRQRHSTFARLIAEYRVYHAQRLLAEQPDMKLSSLIAASGFTSESTFFRTFKVVTGLSPKEWLAQNNV